MAFSLYLCLNVMILLSCTGARDLSDSTEGGGKEDNVTHNDSVILPPSEAHQHEHGDDDKEETEMSDEKFLVNNIGYISNINENVVSLVDGRTALPAAPSSVLYLNMDEQQEKLKKLEDEINREKKDLEDTKSQFKKNRESFDSRKIEEDKYLAKKDEIKEGKAKLEEELRNVKELLDKKIKDLDEKDEELKKEDKSIEEFESRKKTIEEIETKLQGLSSKRDNLQEDIKNELGNCVEIPQRLRIFWNVTYTTERRLCSKSSS